MGRMRVLLPFPHERRVLLILLPVPRRLPLPFPLARLDVADIPALSCGTPEVNPALVLLAVVHAATRLEALLQALRIDQVLYIGGGHRIIVPESAIARAIVLDTPFPHRSRRPDRARGALKALEAFVCY